MAQDGSAAQGLFIGLGFQKCATTQVTMRLARHPQVWTHPVRELNFWNTHFRNRALPPQTKYFRALSERLLAADTTPKSRQRNLKKLETWVKYARSANRGAEDYLRLFEDRAPSARAHGEISPSYATLSAGEIARIYGLLGRPRLFVTMRDPVARVLSQVNHEGQRRPDNVATTERQLAFLRSDKVREICDYPRVIAALRALSDQENVGIFFFEDFVADMEGFFRSLCAFLGVGYHRRLVRDIPRAAPRGTYRTTLDPAVAALAEELYGGMRAEVARLVGRTPAAWGAAAPAPAL